MSNTAAQIRAALKAEKGWTSKQVSVRTRPGTGSVSVVVRVPGIPLAEVARIAGRFEQVDRCSTTGEILAGGNTFVFVTVALPGGAALAERIRQAAYALRRGETLALPCGIEIHRPAS